MTEGFSYYFVERAEYISGQLRCYHQHGRAQVQLVQNYTTAASTVVGWTSIGIRIKTVASLPVPVVDW